MGGFLGRDGLCGARPVGCTVWFLFPSLCSPGNSSGRSTGSHTHRLIHHPEAHSPSRTSCVTSRLDCGEVHLPTAAPPQPRPAVPFPGRPHTLHQVLFFLPWNLVRSVTAPSDKTRQERCCGLPRPGHRVPAATTSTLFPGTPLLRPLRLRKEAGVPIQAPDVGVKELPEDSSSSHQAASGHWNPPSSDLGRGKQ